MIRITSILTNNTSPHFHAVLVLVVRLTCPLWELCYDTFQVLNTIITRLHIVISKLFCLCTWVFILTLTTKPKPWILCKNGCCLSHQLLLLVHLIFELWTILIAPTDCPLVVIVHTWEESALRNAIFWLCNVIETSVVHNAGSVTMFLYPLLIA